MPILLIGTFSIAAMATLAPAAERRPANSLRELFGALESCLRTPGAAANSQITIRFALKRDGSLLGRPKITFARLAGDPLQQRLVIAGIAAAFARCLPAPITDGLGGAIAGRPLSIRFINRGRQTDT